MTKRKTEFPKQAPKSKETAPSSASVDSILDSIASSVRGEFTLGGLIGGVSQIAVSTMIRTQLERIADAMELEALGDRHPHDDKPLIEARDFLRSKIIARNCRERASSETMRTETARTATTTATTAGKTP